MVVVVGGGGGGFCDTGRTELMAYGAQACALGLSAKVWGVADALRHVEVDLTGWGAESLGVARGVDAGGGVSRQTP